MGRNVLDFVLQILSVNSEEVPAIGVKLIFFMECNALCYFLLHIFTSNGV